MRALSRTGSTVMLGLCLMLAALSANAGATLDEQLKTLSGRVGIWYFYMSTCPYCLQQEPSLDVLDKQYGIPVTPISLDGGPPPGAHFSEYIPDRGQSVELGVQVTPTLYLVHPATREAALLSRGLTPPRELYMRITSVASAAGWMNAPAGDSSTVTTRTISDAIVERLRAKGDPAW